MGVALLLGAGGVFVGWQAQQRLQELERELVRRQQASDTLATEARLLAAQSQDASRDAVARVALLDARVTESAAERSQVEELLLSLSRSRDENVVADLEAAIRLAVQRSALTGGNEPLVLALKQADERLQRLNQPRLEGIRRAIARDLERVGAAGGVDIATLSLRIDEIVRQVDDLPLVAVLEPRRGGTAGRRDAAVPARGAASAAAGASAPAVAASAPPAQGAGTEGWYDLAKAAMADFAARVWGEARSLLRVSQIEHPDALLLAPDQAYFVRENLKLRLLNARLALLSRQFDVLQADLDEARHALDRYFDRQSSRVQSAADLLKQVVQQARQVTLPRPEDTLAALAAVAAPRR